MEAKSQQNFYIKAAIVVNSSKLPLRSIHFQDLVQKNHEISHNNPQLPVYVAYSIHTVQYQLGTLSSLNSLSTCVQDMKFCPTHAVEYSKIHNGFDAANSRFQTRQPTLSHMCSIGFKSCNKLCRGRLAMFC